MRAARAEAPALLRLRAHFLAAVGALPAGCRVTVGFSGGVDSAVLLHLFCTVREVRQLRLDAVHIHHGISAHADAWAAFAARVAARRGVPLRQVRVDIGPYRHEGLEAAARRARYAVFRALPCDVLALAHHADDQAETVLLQLLRGAGPAGLAAMPESRWLTPAPQAAAARVAGAQAAGGGLRLIRPLLSIRRSQIEAYARAARLRWVHDESNEDLARTRNALRHQVMPLLEGIAPAAVANIQRSARLVAQAAQLQAEQARSDLGQARRGAGLSLAALRALPEARALAVLRRWLAEQLEARLSEAQSAQLWAQMSRARADAQPLFPIGASRVRRYRDAIVCEAGPAVASPVPVLRWDRTNPWSLEPLAGTLVFAPALGAGIRAQVLDGARSVEVRPRAPERFRRAGSAHRRTLKKLFQDCGIPAWQRARLPFLYLDGTLAWIAGVGIAEGFAAGPGEAGYLPLWEGPGEMPSDEQKVMLK